MGSPARPTGKEFHDVLTFIHDALSLDAQFQQARRNFFQKFQKNSKISNRAAQFGGRHPSYPRQGHRQDLPTGYSMSFWLCFNIPRKTIQFPKLKDAHSNTDTGIPPREDPRPDVPTGIPRLSERISCFLGVRHTIRGPGTKSFQYPQ